MLEEKQTKLLKKFITTLMCFWMLVTEMPVNVVFAEGEEIVEEVAGEGSEDTPSETTPEEPTETTPEAKDDSVGGDETPEGEIPTTPADETSVVPEEETGTEGEPQTEGEELAEGSENDGLLNLFEAPNELDPGEVAENAENANVKVGNNRYYETLEDAINNLDDDKTITLLNDLLLESINIPSGVTLDTNKNNLFNIDTVGAVDSSDGVEQLRNAINNQGTVIVYQENVSDALVLLQVNGKIKIGENVNAIKYEFPAETIITTVVHNEHKNDTIPDSDPEEKYGTRGQYQEFKVAVPDGKTVVWNEPLKAKNNIVVNGNIKFGGEIIYASTKDSVDIYNNNTTFIITTQH